jgi:exopolyphosphatase / guanosine-5'-triphosphate,3'-diphosphate pyrophosphatase
MECENVPRAILAIGTNTVRVLVVIDRATGRTEEIEHRAIGTRLGEGLSERGMLGQAAMRRTLDAAACFIECVRLHGASLVCIATSAMRRAENASVFAERLQAVTGEPLQIIDGNEEAAASFRGATYEDDPGDARRVAVLDIGGGSTECAIGSGGAVEYSASLELGTVRLTERYPGLNGSVPGASARRAAADARAFVAQALLRLCAFPPAEELRAVAGTPATIAAIATASDVEHVRGVRLRREVVASTLERLLDACLEERRTIPGMLPQRADVLAAGAIILGAAMDALGCREALVEMNDLLLGYLLRHSPIGETRIA